MRADDKRKQRLHAEQKAAEFRSKEVEKRAKATKARGAATKTNSAVTARRKLRDAERYEDDANRAAKESAHWQSRAVEYGQAENRLQAEIIADRNRQ